MNVHYPIHLLREAISSNFQYSNVHLATDLDWIIIIIRDWWWAIVWRKCPVLLLGIDIGTSLGHHWEIPYEISILEGKLRVVVVVLYLLLYLTFHCFGFEMLLAGNWILKEPWLIYIFTSIHTNHLIDLHSYFFCFFRCDHQTFNVEFIYKYI